MSKKIRVASSLVMPLAALGASEAEAQTVPTDEPSVRCPYGQEDCSTEPVGQARFGVMLGVGFSGVFAPGYGSYGSGSYDSDVNVRARIGPQFGVRARLPRGTRGQHYFSPGLVYTQFGERAVAGPVTATRKLNYLSIPVTWGRRIAGGQDESEMQVHFLIGTGIMIQLKSETVVEGLPSTSTGSSAYTGYSGSYTYDSGSYDIPVTANLEMGVAVTIPASSMLAEVALRGYQGITPSNFGRIEFNQQLALTASLFF